VADTFNVKLPPGLRKQLEKAAKDRATSVHDEIVRRLSASLKSKREKKFWVADHEELINYQLFVAVQRRPKNISESAYIREHLSRRGPFKTSGSLRDRYNKFKKALRERGELEERVKQIQDGRDLIFTGLLDQEAPLNLAAATALAANLRAAREEVDRLSKADRDYFLLLLDAIRKVMDGAKASPLGYEAAVQELQKQKLADTPPVPEGIQKIFSLAKERLKLVRPRD
jgi:hypothetical protein